jgi:dolichyl-phosphate-mannose--protein O-mannosyl transferase
MLGDVEHRGVEHFITSFLLLVTSFLLLAARIFQIQIDNKGMKKDEKLSRR